MLMWRDWRPEAVEREFAAIAANGLHVLRVFPLWSDFQPISRILGGGGSFCGWGGPDGREVRGDGVDAEMLARFRAMCDMAQRHGLRLVVGLVTGWMSGRLFVPPALGAGSNPAYLIYREAMRIAGVKRLVEKGDVPSVGLTEHAFGDERTLVMAVNYGPVPVRCPFTTVGRLDAVHCGLVTDGAIDLGGNDVAVFEVLD